MLIVSVHYIRICNVANVGLGCSVFSTLSTESPKCNVACAGLTQRLFLHFLQRNTKTLQSSKQKIGKNEGSKITQGMLCIFVQTLQTNVKNGLKPKPSNATEKSRFLVILQRFYLSDPKNPLALAIKFRYTLQKSHIF